MRRLCLSLSLVVLLVEAAHPAAARTHVSLGFGAVFAPVPYGYYPPPVYYYPPPIYYSPAPALVGSGATVTPTPQRYCREYQGNATIDGAHQPFYGTACLEPDGKWHIVK